MKKNKGITAEEKKFILGLVSHNVSEREIFSKTWRNIDADELSVCLNELVYTGMVERKFIGPNKEPGTWYYPTTDEMKAYKQKMINAWYSEVWVRDVETGKILPKSLVKEKVDEKFKIE